MLVHLSQRSKNSERLFSNAYHLQSEQGEGLGIVCRLIWIPSYTLINLSADRLSKNPPLNSFFNSLQPTSNSLKGLIRTYLGVACHRSIRSVKGFSALLVLLLLLLKRAQRALQGGPLSGNDNILTNSKITPSESLCVCSGLREWGARSKEI